MKKKLPTLPNFDELNEKSRNNYTLNSLKIFKAYYILDVKTEKILHRSFDIEESQKRLRYMSYKYQKENKKNKSPFLILTYENRKIISPELDNNENLLKNINNMEKKFDDNLGDLVENFIDVFKKKEIKKV